MPSRIKIPHAAVSRHIRNQGTRMAQCRAWVSLEHGFGVSRANFATLAIGWITTWNTTG